MMHSEAVRKDLGFTHVMFIGGLNIPGFVFKSLYDVKSVVVATEDPHTFDPLKDKLDDIDYYFSNEKSIATSDQFDNTYYCPTAADTFTCGSLPRNNLDDKYHSDVLFLGAMYPNREKMLSGILSAVKKYGWNFKIMGHPGFMKEENPLWEYVPEENFDVNGNIVTVPHEETVKYYNGAKVVLNFFRDTEWNPRTNDMANPYNSDKFEAQSLNPRAYEVPLCGSLQMLEDTRKEARQVFNEDEVAFFSDSETLASQLEYYLEGDGVDKVKDMTMKALLKVSEGHTYLHRMKSILKVIEKDLK